MINHHSKLPCEHGVVTQVRQDMWLKSTLQPQNFNFLTSSAKKKHNTDLLTNDRTINFIMVA